MRLFAWKETVFALGGGTSVVVLFLTGVVLGVHVVGDVQVYRSVWCGGGDVRWYNGVYAVTPCG